jgi:hypothetical protein
MEEAFFVLEEFRAVVVENNKWKEEFNSCLASINRLVASNYEDSKFPISPL